MKISPRDRELLTLAIPALGALIAEPLYVLADTAVVGHLGTVPLAGLAVASAALLLIYGLCFFLAYGTTAAIARLTGAGEEKRAAEHAVQSLWLAIFLGLALAAGGTLAATPLLQLLGARGDLLAHASIYFRLSMYGAPAMLVMLAGVGYLRGIKDTVRPLWVAIGTALLNLVLELVLIYRFDLGIGASAMATVVAQWVGAFCSLLWISRAIRPHHVSLTPDFAAMRRLLTVAGELLVRNMALTSTFVTATAVAARIGTIDVAAHQIAFQAWFVMAMSMDAMAIAAQAMIGNLLGAGRADEAHLVGRRTIVWSVGIGSALSVVLFLAQTPFAQVFSADPAVIALSGFLVVHVALMGPLSGVAFALDGILIGAGDQRHMAKAMASAAGIGIPAIILTRVAGLGIGWVWGGIWIFMLARTSLLYRRFLSGRWQVTGA